MTTMRDALDTLVREMIDLVYPLAAGVLSDPLEAEDATQEIVIQLVTSLGTFRGECAPRTWVYRVATSYLLRAQACRYAKRAGDASARGPETLARELGELIAGGRARRFS